MRKIFFAFVASFFLLFTSCKEIDKLTQFELEYNSTAVIQSSTNINLPFSVFTPDVTTNAEQQFQVNNTHKDLIEQIFLTEMVLEIAAPSNEDFSFLKDLEIFIDAAGLPEAKIASKYNIDPSAEVLTMELSSTDLQEYVKKETFTLKVTAVTDEFIMQDHTLDIKTVFWVDAKLLGV